MHESFCSSKKNCQAEMGCSLISWGKESFHTPSLSWLSCALASQGCAPALGTLHPLALMNLPGRVAGGSTWSLEVSFCKLCPEQGYPVEGTPEG